MSVNWCRTNVQIASNIYVSIIRNVKKGGYSHLIVREKRQWEWLIESVCNGDERGEGTQVDQERSCDSMCSSYISEIRAVECIRFGNRDKIVM